MKKFNRSYEDIVTLKNLLKAWQEFLRGKRTRKDVVLFQVKLMDNIHLLQSELENKTYRHGYYKEFNISDPKPRIIHKALVRDRLLHHLLYQELYKYFDAQFIFDSYSCRRNKGVHKALYRFRAFARKESNNHTTTCWVLKCDIRKFFASIDHKILEAILEKHISDTNLLWLLRNVIASFQVSGEHNVGLPLGNLTSQLFVNIYMNEFDQFVKGKLKAKRYIRYADDFVILSRDKKSLERLLPQIEQFLWEKLRLTLHPNKVSISTYASGIDFLGWVHFPHHSSVRTVTKRRMLKNLSINSSNETLTSYLGLLKHGNAHSLRSKILRERNDHPTD